MCKLEADGNIEHWILSCPVFKPVIHHHLSGLLTIINTLYRNNQERTLMNIIIKRNHKIPIPNSTYKPTTSLKH